jgi:hypothetical protein
MSTAKKTTKLKGLSDVAVKRVVSRLREQLQNLTNRADYVCAHRYDAQALVGTREVAVSDLGREASKARILLAETANESSSATSGGQGVTNATKP